MSRIKIPFHTLPFALYLMATLQASALQGVPDVKGRWSGTFHSNHSGVDPFTITVVIDADLKAHLVARSELTSACMKGAKLTVTITGSEVVLAGSDKDGDSMTLRGTLDNTGTLLKSTYILNGSATGGCETDDGTGTLTKQ